MRGAQLPRLLQLVSYTREDAVLMRGCDVLRRSVARGALAATSLGEVTGSLDAGWDGALSALLRPAAWRAVASRLLRVSG